MIKRCFFMLILFLMSCSMKNKYYDIDGPKFEFYSFYDDYIIFQFNEPVVFAKFILENNIEEVKNLFPVANVRIKKSFFSDKGGKLFIESKDNTGNESKNSVIAPIINENPAEIDIEKIRIIHTKKRKQMLRLKASKAGSLYGYKLVLFIRSEKVVLPFDSINVNKNNYVDVYINLDDSKNNQIKSINFDKKSIDLFLKCRLSQISSLVYILNNEEKIINAFLYYNSKKHPVDYYKNNKAYNNYLNELKSFGIECGAFDIGGSTSTKIIQKINNKYWIKKD